MGLIQAAFLKTKLAMIQGGPKSNLESAWTNSDKLNANSNIPLAKGIKSPKIVKLAAMHVPKAITNIVSKEGREIGAQKYLELAERGYPESKAIGITLRHLKELGHNTKQAVPEIIKEKPKLIQPSLFNKDELK